MSAASTEATSAPTLASVLVLDLLFAWEGVLALAEARDRALAGLWLLSYPQPREA